jgi:outer membrane protein, heavy metal efflux system
MEKRMNRFESAVRSFPQARVQRLALALLLVTPAFAPLLRASPQSSPPATQASPQAPAAAPTPLAALVEEVRKHDPRILAAEDAARAAGYAAPQESALPDPMLTLQLFSVGSPRPFAGYSNSDFAYTGFGVSQDLPYPGKRRLRAGVADREADAAKHRAEAVTREDIAALQEACYRLAYLQQTLALLERNDTVVQQITQVAEARYRMGQGNQQDILKAQLQQTKLLYDISMNRRSAGEAQAELKQILRRPQDSPDIVAEALTVTPLRLTPGELLARLEEQNPDLGELAAMVKKNEAQVDLARREFRPDFGLSYMYQHTGGNFRDYYMFTFDLKFPRRKPREAALAQAQVNVERARQERDAQAQQIEAALQKQIVTIRASEEQSRLYREGLIPQAQATFQAGIAAYQVGRADFETLLSSLLDTINLDLEYQQTLLDHEMAVAQIERLTGGILP